MRPQHQRYLTVPPRRHHSSASTLCVAIWFALLSAFFYQPISANVTSLSGNIDFYTSSSLAPLANLSATGFGIGTTPQANLHVAGNAFISQQLLIGGNANSSGSNLHINGTIGFSMSTLTTGLYTMTSPTTIIADTSAGDVAIQLPSAVAFTGSVINIKRTSLQNVLYLSGAGNLMDQNALVYFGSGNLDSLSMVSNGSQWYLLNVSSSTILGESTYLWWNLDATSGNTVADSSGWQRTGTLKNNHQFSGNSITGPVNKGLLFDDPNDASEYTGSSIPNAIGYTYLMWVKSTVSTADNVEIPSDLNANAGFSWGNRTASLSRAAYHKTTDGTRVLTQHGSDLSANTWYHIAVSWDGALLRLYVNGTPSTSVAATSWAGGTTISTPHPGTFRSGNVQYDDVRFYNRALSSTLIQAIYSLGTP